MSTMPGMPAEVREALAKNWKLLVAGGILAIILGLIAIILPLLASLTITIVVGILLLIGAVGFIADAISGGTTWHRIGRIILAIIYVVAGVWLLINPIEGTITLTIVLIVFFLISGIFRIIAGLQARGNPGSGWLIVNGVLSIVIALLVWADFPSSAEWAVGLLVGIALLFDGIAFLTTGLAGKKAAESGSSETA
jgi:uncharacterized membrane protein HdeD (DUF308 family)